MTIGALNFDILVDENDRVFILEIGPRNGGNMIPELTNYSTGIDMIEYSIKAALGENIENLKMGYEKKYFSHYVIHAQKSGEIRSVKESEVLKEHLLYKHFNFSLGEKVERFNSSANRLGIMLLKYSTEDEMLDLIYNMDKYLQIDISIL